MATRFYLPSTGTAGASPAVDAAWDFSVSAFIRRATVTTKISSAFTTISLDGNTDSNDTDYCYVQWVSAPIAAQTISAQTVDWVVSLFEENARANQYLAMCIRVVSGDGATVRGTIRALQRDGTELGTSQSSRYDTTTSTEVVASAGDRIVIEIGTGGNPEVGSGGDSHDADVRIGDNSATDFGEGGGETADYCGWVEFASTITFAAAAYTLTCDAGSFTHTGQTCALTAARLITATYGAFTNTGQAVSLLASRILTCVYGAFAETGQDAGLSAARFRNAEHGTFTLAGQDVTLTYATEGAYSLTCDVGSFTLTGQDVTLKAARKLTASMGMFNLITDSLTAAIVALAPIADWPLKELSGTAAVNHGTLGAAANGVASGITWAQIAAPGGGYAPYFDGVNNFINIYSAALAAAYNFWEVTISIWIKPYNAAVWDSTTGRYPISVRDNAAPVHTYIINKSTVANQFNYEVNINGTVKLVAKYSVTESGWILATMTLSVTGDSFKAYYNNLQTGSTQTGIGTPSSPALISGACAIGALNTSATAPWYGYLAHAVICNYVTTPEQIAGVYAAGQEADWTLLTAQRKLTADNASYSLTGQDITLTRALVLSTEYAAFTLTGQDATLSRALIVAMVYTLYTLTGQDVTLTFAEAAGDTPGSVGGTDAVIYSVVGVDAAVYSTVGSDECLYSIVGSDQEAD